MLLSDSKLFAVLPVADVDKSVKFYTEKLGLSVMGGKTDDEGVGLLAGDGTGVYIYKKPHAEVDFTQAGFMVDDLEKVMKDLQGKGIQFEEYDMPGLRTVGGVATAGDNKSAWFKDPDGNIIALNQMSS